MNTYDVTQALIEQIESEHPFDYDELHELLSRPDDNGAPYDVFVRLSYEICQLPLSARQVERAHRKIMRLASAAFLFNAEQDNQWQDDAIHALYEAV